ncbi:MAG: VOC family protein [Dehalococcoidia bacterium]
MASALHLTLWTTDIPGMTRFLERVAGLKVLGHHPGFAELMAGDSRVTLHSDEAYRGHPWFNAVSKEGVARGIGAEIAFSVANVESAFQVAAREGALQIAPPYEVDGHRECTVMGPDGYLFTLVEG